MREVKLPSGATLKINVSSFAVSKALYQAVLRELKGVSFSADYESMPALFKDLFCAGFTSLDVESCLWKCFERCTYNDGKGDLKIDGDTFEPIESRSDYLSVCAEVAKDNIGPFAKSLFAGYQEFLATVQNIRK